MKILMVCLGNICRSPLAHGILEAEIKKNGLDWQVDSCGTGGYHVGEKPDRRSIEIANLYGIDISNQRARQFEQADFSNFDLILTMDTENYRNVLRYAFNDSDREKVKMILNYTFPGQNRVVPDPYYEGGFDKVFKMLEKAIHSMVSEYCVNKNL